MNKNLPQYEVWVKDKFLGLQGEESSRAFLLSVRALSNQALQFSILLESGALFTGIPVNALSFEHRKWVEMPLHDAQMCTEVFC